MDAASLWMPVLCYLMVSVYIALICVGAIIGIVALVVAGVCIKKRLVNAKIFPF